MSNWVMLGKQGSRLVMNPGSLLEQIYKTCYYPTTSFLDAELGSNPSYTWRGIWEARWLLKKGMRWRVGDGENIIKVWHEA